MNWRAFFPSLKTKYMEKLEGNADKETIVEKRLEKCGNLCQLGIANFFWKGTTGVFKDMKGNNDPNLFYHIAAFTICLLFMAMGTVAAMFPDTSPFPCFMAGLGALLAIVSMLGSYHLDLLAYFPSTCHCCISMVLSSATFTIYWAYAVQDPWIVHLLARFFTALWGLLCRLANKGRLFCGWLGEKGDTVIQKMKVSFGSRKKKPEVVPLLGNK